MGTSSSYSGPSDSKGSKKSGNASASENSTVGSGDTPGIGVGIQPSNTGNGIGGGVGGAPVGKDEKPIPLKKEVPWQAAKIAMSNVAKGGGTRKLIRSAAKSYSKAKGGPKKAAATASGGRSVVVSLGGFLSSVSKEGLNKTLTDLGLSKFIGRDVETVCAAIINELAPSGSSLEDAAARDALVEVISDLFKKFAVDEEGLNKLESIDQETMKETLQECICCYLYKRWIQEVGISLDKKLSSSDVKKIEKKVKNYVYESVKLDFEDRNISLMDWGSKEGKDYIQQKFEEAYSVFEEET